jgi:O-methyltransferase
MHAMRRFIRAGLRGFGFDLVRYTPPCDPVDSFIDLSDDQRQILRAVQPYTMTSLDRLVAVVNAVTHIVQHDIPGDFAECGVWRGGSMMAAAFTLCQLNDTSRTLYLYDTFEGMPAPTQHDRSFDGRDADSLWRKEQQQAGSWCYASLDDVRHNLLSSGYPAEKIVLVEGKVEDTIPGILPPALSLLRLDTDWYESTRHELVHLYPKLNPSGILIIDDYGHWQGARAAVDEYFAAQREPVYLHRIDYTGRMLIKTAPSSPE